MSKLCAFRISLEDNDIPTVPAGSYLIHELGNLTLDQDNGLIHLKINPIRKQIRMKHLADLHAIPTRALLCHELAQGVYTGVVNLICTATKRVHRINMLDGRVLY